MVSTAPTSRPDARNTRMRGGPLLVRRTDGSPVIGLMGSASDIGDVFCACALLRAPGDGDASE